MEKILLVMVILFLVLFGLAILKNYREEKKLIDFKWYFQNIFKGFDILIFSLMGTPAYVRQCKLHPADKEFLTISKELHNRALSYAYHVMISNDMVYHKGDEKRTTKRSGELGYCRRLFDCENFAFALKHNYDIFIARESTTIGKGIPSIVIGYTTKNKQGHAIVEFIVEGKIVHHNCYPKDGSFEEIKLTKDETASMVYIGMG